MGHNGKSSPFVTLCHKYRVCVVTSQCIFQLVVITPARYDEDLKNIFTEELLTKEHNIKTSEFVLFFVCLFKFFLSYLWVYMPFFPVASFLDCYR